ncbi:MAG: triose-phosphate isomerase, partial [Deltaproteobacteria bacterium]
VIIGHSERRQYFGETDETVSRKIGAALRAGLRPILCVGETLEQRDAGKTLEVVKRQFELGCSGLGASDAGRLVLAYEPVWAIGTGRTATPQQAQEVHAYLRGLAKELFGDETGEGMRILYGGSVKPENASDLLAQPDIDGALVGGASLKGESFGRIIMAAQSTGE